jgi:transcription initiation factor IIE alpha subunit
MIRHCPSCGEEVTEYDIVCPHCGGGITFATPTEEFESNDDVDYTTYTGYKECDKLGSVICYAFKNVC